MSIDEQIVEFPTIEGPYNKNKLQTCFYVVYIVYNISKRFNQDLHVQYNWFSI